MCRVFSCVVGEGLLWLVCTLSKTPLAFALLHSVLQGQICLCLQVFLDFLFLHSSPLWWKGHLFWVLVLKGLVGLYRTVQVQLLQHYWLGHRLGLLWYWMVCLGNKQIILLFLRLHPSTAFWTLLLTMMPTPFLLRKIYINNLFKCKWIKCSNQKTQTGWMDTITRPIYMLPTRKSLQSRPTLCNPLDHSPPGSSVHGIL